MQILKHPYLMGGPKFKRLIKSCVGKIMWKRAFSDFTYRNIHLNIFFKGKLAVSIKILETYAFIPNNSTSSNISLKTKHKKKNDNLHR